MHISNRTISDRLVFALTAGLSLLLSMRMAVPAVADGLKAGPLIQVSSNFSPSANAEVEPNVAINPTNRKNIVASWFADDPANGSEAIVVGVSFDGGKKWRNVVVPGLSMSAGSAAFDGSVNEWPSFAPNGDLFLLCLRFSGVTGESAIVVCKSQDGGLTWSPPTNLVDTVGGGGVDKPTITADPWNSKNVYAVWDYINPDGTADSWFARSINGGRTWERARQMYAPAIATNGTTDEQIIILRDGTLLNFFTEFDATGLQSDAQLSVIRSTNRGETWSAPVRAATLPTFFATDPDTGQLIVNSGCLTPFTRVAVNPRSGHLYAVWEDNRFSDGQYGEIAFAASVDGGRTWSTPIPVNKTPNDIPPGDRQAIYPTVAVAADGTIAVTYYDFRFNDTKPGCATDYWLVTCHPDNARDPIDPGSWRNEIRLTSRPFDLEKAPIGFGIGYDLGDYFGLVSDGNDFMAVWSMSHEADPCSVYFRRIITDED